MAAAVQTEWVRRVLGVSPPAPADATLGGQARVDFRGAILAWREASEEVDGQLNALRKILLTTDDPDLHRIADAGLNGITGTRKVTLAKALQEVGAAKGAAVPAAGKAAAKAAAEFRSFVAGDKRIAACDACPEVEVSIAATLGRGLAALENALNQH